MKYHTEKVLFHPTAILWMVVGLFGFCVLPWYMLEDGLFSFSWISDGYPFNQDVAPALFLILFGSKIWLAPIGILLLIPFFLWKKEKSNTLFGVILIFVGMVGLTYVLLQGFSIGIRGWNFPLLVELFGKLSDRQFGMGYGAAFVGAAFLFMLTLGVAARGAVGGDVFVVSSIGLIITLVAIFIFMPIAKMFVSAMVM